MSTKKIHRVLFAFVIAILLLASFLAGRMYTQPMNVQAQEVTGDENRGSYGFYCDINEVAMFSNRAHIRCANSVPVGPDTVHFFAIADSDANKTLINRVIAIGLTNMSMNRMVLIAYDDIASNNPPECLKANCRKLLGISAYK